MRVLIDENVPRSVWELFEERDHEVIHVRERFGTKTPDKVIADGACILGAIIVTWNHKHLKKLSKDLSGGAGLVTFKCLESNGRRRLERFIEEIEWYSDRLAAGVIGSLFLEVAESYLKDNR